MKVNSGMEQHLRFVGKMSVGKMVVEMLNCHRSFQYYYYYLKYLVLMDL